MRFRFVEEQRGTFPVDRLCRVMNVSPRGLRAFRSRPASRRQRMDMVVLAHIKEQSRLSLGIEAEICHDLAGRAAETLIFGDASAGAGGSASSDLSQATRRALAIETAWGLGDLGPLWMPAPETVLLTDDKLRTRVRARLDAAQQRPGNILTTQTANLLGLAEALLKKRRMRAEEILPWVHAVQTNVPQAEEAAGDDRNVHPVI